MTLYSNCPKRSIVSFEVNCFHAACVQSPECVEQEIGQELLLFSANVLNWRVLAFGRTNAAIRDADLNFLFGETKTSSLIVTRRPCGYSVMWDLVLGFLGCLECDTYGFL